MASTTIDTETELSAVNSILGAIGQSPITGSIADNANPEIAFIYNLLRDANVDVQNEGWHFNKEYHVEVTTDNDGKIAVADTVIRMDITDGWRSKEYDTVIRHDGTSRKLYDTLDHTYIWIDGTFWAQDTVYAVGDTVIANGNKYECIAIAGDFKSAAAGTGPSGTGASITDDQVTWKYVESALEKYDVDIVSIYAFERIPPAFQRYITYRASRMAATQLVANPQLVQLLAQQEALSRAACMEYECNQGNHSMFGMPDDHTITTYQPWRNLRR
jgi:hypothetical protein